MTASTVHTGSYDPHAFDALGLVGRLLLTADGTVTGMLEQITGERIVAAGLVHGGQPPIRAAIEFAHPAGAGRLVVRATNLTGSSSGVTYVRARSALVPDALPRDLYADLVGTREPIGRLLRRHRVETFRELLTGRLLVDGENPDPLDDPAASGTDPVRHGPESARVTGACRTYRLHIGGRPAAVIGEVFTAHCLAACTADAPVRSDVP
ncbi:hypothetical protein [Streptomyces sp. NPDC005283]|uniref:hypothetical protein n=1 Tax=Streptomyces sp. NPDC005283 TaxID=3156871 RepID=UPI0034554AB9